MNIQLVLKDDIEEGWNLIEPFIQPAMDFDAAGNTADSVKNAMMRGDVLALVITDNEGLIIAVQTMEIHNDNDEKVLNLLTTAGTRLDEWQDDVLKTLETFAKNLGCDAIRTRGRAGWMRILKKHGFEHLYTITEKRLNNGNQQQQE